MGGKRADSGLNPEDVEFLAGLAERLKAARGARSQSEVARQLGIAQGALSNYERGDRAMDAALLRRLARATGVSPSWLFTGYGEMRPEGIEEERAFYQRIGDIKEASSRVGAAIKASGCDVPGAAAALLVEMVYRYGLSDEDLVRLARELGQENSDG